MELLLREAREALHAAKLSGPGDEEVVDASGVFVPGRVELGGKHTDYAGGQALVCALERGMAFATARGTAFGQRLVVLSVDAGGKVEFDLASPTTGPVALGAAAPSGAAVPGWAVYVSAVVAYLGGRGELPAQGLAVCIKSNLPRDAGLSSSSALVCGMLAVLRGVEPSEIAFDEAGSVEAMDTVGTRGGSQDHAAMLGSREGHVALFSYKAGTKLVKHVAFPESLVLSVAVSGVGACKTGDAKDKYNRLAGAAAEVKRERAEPESNIVVPMAVAALESGDRALLGRALALSQMHAERVLLTTVPETERLVQQALALGAVGATAFGAGFGGAVYAIVEREGADAFLEHWRASYVEAFPELAEKAVFFLARPARGACTLRDCAQ